jgi:excinuclease ABC subunit C
MADRISRIPAEPGVYLFKNRKGKIIYIGKARRLDARVKNHFGAPAGDPRHSSLMEQVKEIDYVATRSEVEALILEANLIKQHRPKYNILLRDDKKYPFVKVSLGEDFPRIVLTRDLRDDGSKYFGPFTDAKAVRQGLRVLRKAFRLRACPGGAPGRIKGRECIDYQIGICSAPCTGKISHAGYGLVVEELLACLKGQSEHVMEALQRGMETASAHRQYEKCTVLRDRMKAIESSLRRQHVFTLRDYDSDVIGLGRHEDSAAAVVLKVREGKVLGKETLLMEGALGKSDAEVLSSVISQYYLRPAVIPGEVLVPVSVAEDEAVLSSWLTEKADRKVTLRVPQKGSGAALLEMASQNALLALQESMVADGERPQRIPPQVQELQVGLGLPALPVRMEAFDISQLSGNQAVASVIVFHNAEPRRSDYRRMRIRGVVGQDDYRMMHEAVSRRAARLIKEKRPLPDFILVDGGKTQVSAAALALEEAGLARLRVIGLAKEREEFHFSWRDGTLQLPPTSRAFRTMAKMRDEAHRFAVSYHRKLRTRDTIKSSLDDIPGVGAARRKALLRQFGSVAGLRRASAGEVARVGGIGPVLARRILAHVGATGRRAAEGEPS